MVLQVRASQTWSLVNVLYVSVHNTADEKTAETLYLGSGRNTLQGDRGSYIQLVMRVLLVEARYREKEKVEKGENVEHI